MFWQSAYAQNVLKCGLKQYGARVACAAYLKQGCIGLALEQSQILQGLLVEGLLGSGGLIVHLSLQHDNTVRHVTSLDDICEVPLRRDGRRHIRLWGD